MPRQGKYTKKTALLKHPKWWFRRKVRWFMKLKLWQKAAVVSAPVVLFLVVTPLVTYLYFYNDIADQNRLMNRANTGIVLLDKDGKEFFSIGRAEHNDLVPLSHISDDAEDALIASEDKDFYKHSGFSALSILRSAYLNIFASGSTTYGGSTLTQQLAKNTLLSQQRTFMRKYQELTIALAIEHRYSKDEILAMYLNSVYYGNNAFGIEDAAQTYFGKPASKLTLAESSMLIGVLPAPSAYSPVGGSTELAKKRQRIVLDRMVKNDMISEQEAADAAKMTLSYLPQKATAANIAPHFTEMVLNELYEKYGEEKVKRSGYQIRTTLDRSLQVEANAQMDANASNIVAYGGSNASLVAIDPKTGAIRALVGSIDYDNEKFGMVNMATTPRQPASTMKPIYYASALADGVITTETVLRDEPTNFNGYTPKNATGNFYGNVSVRKALNWSLNIPAVKILQRYGIDKAVDAAKKVGITTLKDPSQYGLSLAIGSAEVPLIEMTGAYSTYANAGIYNEKRLVDSIEDKYGKKITFEYGLSTRAVSEQGAYLITDILSDSATRGAFFGRSLNVVGSDYRTKTVAVKTGSTDEYRDAWTIGYTPSIAVGVWAGNNDNSVMQAGGNVVAGPIWRAVMGKAIGTSDPEFVRPVGIVERTVCTAAAGIRTDVFLSTAVEPSTCSTTPIKKEEPKKQPEEDTDDTTEIPEDTPDTTEPDDTTENPEEPGNGNGNPDTDPADPTTPPGNSLPLVP